MESRIVLPICVLLACVLQAQTRTNAPAGEFRREEAICEVNATYPAAARAARISGVVILEAVVNSNGVVDSLRLVSGHRSL